MSDDRLTSALPRSAQRFRKLPPGRQGFPREHVDASQRGRLMDAMILVVAERGYAGLRVAEVSAVAGVSRKDFYRLYKDGGDCFAAAVGRWGDRLYAMRSPAFDPAVASSWPERVRLGLSAHLAFVAEHPAVARACIVEAIAAGRRPLARRDAAIRPFLELVDAGRRETSIHPPSATARLVVGGITEVVRNELLHGAAASLPRQAPELTQLVLQAYLGGERAQAEHRRAITAAAARPR